MQKPVDLIVIDKKAGLISLANESGLPLSVLAMIFGEINTTIQSQLDTQEQELRAQYNAQLAQEQAQAQTEGMNLIDVEQGAV